MFIAIPRLSGQVPRPALWGFEVKAIARASPERARGTGDASPHAHAFAGGDGEVGSRRLAVAALLHKCRRLLWNLVQAALRLCPLCGH